MQLPGLPFQPKPVREIIRPAGSQELTPDLIAQGNITAQGPHAGTRGRVEHDCRVRRVFTYGIRLDGVGDNRTYTSAYIGEPAPDRVVVLLGYAQDVTTPAQTTNVLFNGIQTAHLSLATAAGGGWISSARVPYGTKMDIATSYLQDDFSSSALGVWALYGCKRSSPYATVMTNVNTPGQGTIVVPGGGVVVGAFGRNNFGGAQAGNPAWTGIDNDYATPSAEEIGYSFASREFPLLATVFCANPDTGDAAVAFLLASFR